MYRKPAVLTTTTVLIHVTVPRISPLPQYKRGCRGVKVLYRKPAVLTTTTVLIHVTVPRISWSQSIVQEACRAYHNHSFNTCDGPKDFMESKYCTGSLPCLPQPQF